LVASSTQFLLLNAIVSTPAGLSWEPTYLVVTGDQVGSKTSATGARERLEETAINHT